MKNLLWIMLAFVALCGIYGCKTQKQMRTEFIYIDRTDTLTQVKYRVDSINIHDSIVTFIKGDTVITDRWHTEYRDKLRVDTVEKVRTETQYLTRTETQVKEVPRRLTWWQKTLMWLGVAFFALLAFVAYRLVKKHTP